MDVLHFCSLRVLRVARCERFVLFSSFAWSLFCAAPRHYASERPYSESGLGKQPRESEVFTSLFV